MKRMIIALMLISLAVPCLATTRLMKLAEDRYLITHQKQTMWGGQGKALRLAYVKAGSLCTILDYSWFEIRDTQSKGRTWGSGAASTLEVKFFRDKHEADEDAELLDCAELATEEQKEKMRQAVRKLDR